MLITSAIPNLVNGVSQQPATLRLASQAEEQVNFLSSVSDGLKRRPGTRHIAKLSSTAWTDAFLHTINRDRFERYLVVVRAGQLQVFDAITGLAKTVNAPDGWGYLDGANKTDIRAVTVADYTFILNRKKVTAMDTALTAARPNNGIVVIRGGNYGKVYRISVAGVSGTYTTPDGSVASHITDVRTTAIAAGLLTSLNAVLPAGYSATRSGDAITITSTGTTPFDITASDDAGGAAMVSIAGTIQRFSDLPRIAPNGFCVEIAGDNTSKFDNYHVRFDSDGTSGVWKEVAKGGEQYRLSAATMPHILVRESNGTFTFRRATWADRQVGDRARIPDPSFVGRPISDVFFYRNRLGFLADENVILSKQGEFFDYWRDTATTVLDTDPLDIAVSNTKVSILNHALPFNQTLLLFSDNAQFTLQGGDILSAETAFVTQATEFESTGGVRPVGVGQYVYFPVPRGSYTGFREYFVQNGNEQNDASDVTSHCPRYIPKDIIKLAASTSEDILVTVSASSPNTLWVYKYYYGEGGKLQSSWSRWDLSTDDTILSAEFIESALFMVVARPDGTYIDRMDIESGALDSNASVYYHVDRGLFLTAGVYNSTTNLTTFTLPYATSQPLWVFVAGGDGVYPEGLAVNGVTRPSTYTVVIPGNWTGRSLFCGLKYTSAYRFSTLFLRTQEAGGGVTAMDDGRLQVRRMSLNFANSGYFKTTVTPLGRMPSVREYTGRRLASSSAILGGFELSDGRFSFPVLGRNKDISVEVSSDHFLSCAFTSAEWEATYHTRARRI